MLHKRALLEHRESAHERLAVERAVDSVLADSFPASDPPSWTLGITRPQPQPPVTNVNTVASDGPETTFRRKREPS